MKLRPLFAAAALAVALPLSNHLSKADADHPAADNGQTNSARIARGVVTNDPGATSAAPAITVATPAAATATEQTATAPVVVIQQPGPAGPVAERVRFNPDRIQAMMPNLDPMNRPVEGFIVTYKDDPNDPDDAARALSDKAGQDIRYNASAENFHVFDLAKPVIGRDAAKIAEELKKADPNIDEIIPDIQVDLSQAQTPDSVKTNDPYWPDMWHLRGGPGGGKFADAWSLLPKKEPSPFTGIGGIVWNVAQNFRKVGVAVVDTGGRLHNDMKGPIKGYDFYDNDNDPTDPGDACQTATECAGSGIRKFHSLHGMHIQSIIGANTNNAAGVAGIMGADQMVDFYHYRFFGQKGSRLSAYAAAIGAAADNPAVRIVNLSQGTYAPCPSIVQTVINKAASKNKVVVASAGNVTALPADGFFPGNCKNVITVAATSKFGTVASYSSRGANVTISAPGGDMATAPADGITVNTVDQYTGVIPANKIGTTQEYVHGTSFSAAVGSGLAAQILLTNPGLNYKQVKDIMFKTARPLAEPTPGMGSGIVDAFAAVTLAQNTTPIALPAAAENGSKKTCDDKSMEALMLRLFTGGQFKCKKAPTVTAEP